MNIIYIVFAPIPIHYANYLNIQNFKKNGFDVHICDVSSFFYSEDQKNAYFRTTAQFYLKRHGFDSFTQYYTSNIKKGLI